MLLRLANLVLLLIGLWWVSPASAHEPSKSYVNLMVKDRKFTGQWDIALKDLQTVIHFNLGPEGAIPLDELRRRYPEVKTYARSHLEISVDGRPRPFEFTTGEPEIGEFSDGLYVELALDLPGPEPSGVVGINYTLFFETNSLHRGLLRWECDGVVESTVFSPDDPVQQIQVRRASPGSHFARFLKEGVGHIWTGYDHILFLLALLLPAVLFRETGSWRPVPAFRPALVKVVKIVTAFTVAHSLTLSLAALHLVQLPTRLTESAIAASVILAAANNLSPVIRERGWMVAFVFGLIHGFGFANALSELGLNQGGLYLVLLGFNLGVELGQLAIVAMFFPMAYAMRSSRFYRQILLGAGSVIIVLIAATWFCERVLDFKLLPF